MIYIITSILDRSVDAFMPITCVRADGEAIRAFSDAVNDPNNRTLYRHPDDYDLYRLGTFDDSSGEVVKEQPKKLADGKQMRQTGE